MCRLGFVSGGKATRMRSTALVTSAWLGGRDSQGLEKVGCGTFVVAEKGRKAHQGETHSWTTDSQQKVEKKKHVQRGKMGQCGPGSRL